MKSSRRNFIRNITIGAASLPIAVAAKNIDSNYRFDRNALWLREDEPNWERVRNEFLLSKEKRYFNTASLGPSPNVVVQTVCDAMQRLEISGEHGQSETQKIHQKIATFLNCTADEIAITRNTTEGMNIVARGLRLKEGDEVLLSKHEHIGGTAPWLALQKDIGIIITLIDLDLNGENNVQIIKSAISSKTKVVSLSHVTCTTGLLLPIKEISAFCREKGVITCIDGAQALGMLPIDLEDINPDFYATSGHKWLFGPKGTGILFINKKVLPFCNPIFAGAYANSTYHLNSLEMEYRATAQREEYGTRNTPIILGLGAAVDFISNLGIDNIEKRGSDLANRFRKGIAKNTWIEILSPRNKHFSTAIVTFTIANIENKVVIRSLQENHNFRLREIYENNLNGIRISFSLFNTEEEVDLLVKALNEITQK